MSKSMHSDGFWQITVLVIPSEQHVMVFNLKLLLGCLGTMCSRPTSPAFGVPTFSAPCRAL